MRHLQSRCKKNLLPILGCLIVTLLIINNLSYKTTMLKEAEEKEKVFSLSDYKFELLETKTSATSTLRTITKDNHEVKNVLPTLSPTKEIVPDPRLAPEFRIHVFTYKRVNSLNRLLNSLTNAHYDDNYRNNLYIYIDLPSGKPEHYAEVVTAAKNFKWPHGSKEVILHKTNQGIVGQWLSTWNIEDPETNERAIFLEDDVEVSPSYLEWVNTAHDKYQDNPQYAGVTLARADMVPIDRNRNKIPYNDKVRVFFYKLVGSHGYSPTAKNWFHFRQWYYTQKLDVNFHPYVDGLVTTEWYKLFETQGRENTMWTQWYIYYVNLHDLYVCYANAYGATTFGADWQEPGEHSEGRPRRDAALYEGNFNTILFKMPNEPLKLGWDGKMKNPSSLNNY